MGYPNGGMHDILGCEPRAFVGAPFKGLLLGILKMRNGNI